MLDSYAEFTNKEYFFPRGFPNKPNFPGGVFYVPPTSDLMMVFLKITVLDFFLSMPLQISPDYYYQTALQIS
jgi:hypothetical protein